MFEYYDKDKMLVPIKNWTESIYDIEESCLQQKINLAMQRSIGTSIKRIMQ